MKDDILIASPARTARLFKEKGFANSIDVIYFHEKKMKFIDNPSIDVYNLYTEDELLCIRLAAENKRPQKGRAVLFAD